MLGFNLAKTPHVEDMPPLEYNEESQSNRISAANNPGYNTYYTTSKTTTQYYITNPGFLGVGQTTDAQTVSDGSYTDSNQDYS